MPTILLVEDEQAMADGLRDALEHHGYTVRVAPDGETGLHLARTVHPNLVVLDVMLPGQDGFEICRQLRSERFAAPIIMLTARSEEVDRIVGLEIGADDYVVKPFSTRELLARVKAHLRRQANASPMITHCTFGDVIVDFAAATASRAGQPVDLTSTELAILRLLVEKENEVVSREQIMNYVWGYESYPESRTVDTHVLNLRHKLEKDPRKPRFILTVHGVGYRFTDDRDPSCS